MKSLITASLLSMCITIILGLIFIPLLKKLKAGQPILSYVTEHKNKNGTPTMGGLFFILSVTIVFLVFGGGTGRVASVSLVIGLGFMIVGITDDFIKIKSKQNEGLKPWQKILFQMVISIFAGVFCYLNGLTIFYLPFSEMYVDFRFFTIPVVALVFVAITNSVNLTDGLDGLAGSTSIMYLLSVSTLIIIEQRVMNIKVLSDNEYFYLNLLSYSLIGGLVGFLFFNVSKAKVFMGDTGSLALGGFLGSIAVFSSNSLFIPIIGIMFVFSSISVIMQVISFKLTKKRIFLMAPFHHHLEMKGKSETFISYTYGIITLVMGLICIIAYL